MEKFNKEDFPLLFKSVSVVLGDEEPEEQLSIAYESSGGVGWEDNGYISCAFSWIDTLQGWEYWSRTEAKCLMIVKDGYTHV